MLLKTLAMICGPRRRHGGRFPQHPGGGLPNGPISRQLKTPGAPGRIAAAMTFSPPGKGKDGDDAG